MNKQEMVDMLTELAEFYEELDAKFAEYIQTILLVLRHTNKLPRNGTLYKLSLCYEADLEARKQQAQYNLDQSLSVKGRRSLHATSSTHQRRIR